MIIPFAHSGVRNASDEEKQLVEGMDVKLITSTSGTCTLISPDSYLKLLSPIATRVHYNEHTNNPNFNNQILEYFNNYQHYTVNNTVNYYNTVNNLGLKPTYIPEIKRWWYKIPSKQTLDGHMNIVSNTYEMKCFNEQTTCTKVYDSIPETDPLWSAIQPIAGIMHVEASEYREKPFIIYMYIDQNGKFMSGITPDTRIGITLHEILHNTNETIKSKLEKDVPVHYVFADPNCSYGDPNCSFYVPNCSDEQRGKGKRKSIKKRKSKKSAKKTKKQTKKNAPKRKKRNLYIF